MNTKPLRLSADTVEKNKKNDLAPPQVNSAANFDSSQNSQFIWNGPNQVTVGEQFTLTLRAKLGDSAKALPIQINYDASMLEVTKIIEGDLIRQEGINEKPNFQLDSKKGKFSVDLSRLKAQNVSVRW